MQTIQRKLSPEHRTNLETRLRVLSSDLTNTEEGRGEETIFSIPDSMQDRSRYTSDMQRIKNMLEIDNSLVAKGKGERARLAKRKSEIEITIRANFPTWREQWVTVKTSGPVDFEKSVQHSMLFMQKYIKMIEEWKQIMRRLEPEDPTADSVYHLCSGIQNGRIT